MQAKEIIKRIFDLTFGLLGLTLTLPLFLLISLLIILQDGYPVFYSQNRTGKLGKIFKSFKFRSMVQGAEVNLVPIQAEETDKRITRSGNWLRKSAMDELPQLLNILKGDMSFVGPRTLRPEEKEVGSNRVVSVFDYPDFQERSKVRPGLTGIAQILLPRDAPREAKFKYDLWYVKHQSFSLDIYLIFLSFLVTFMRKWETRADKFMVLGCWLRKRVEKDLVNG